MTSQSITSLEIKNNKFSIGKIHPTETHTHIQPCTHTHQAEQRKESNSMSHTTTEPSNMHYKNPSLIKFVSWLVFRWIIEPQFGFTLKLAQKHNEPGVERKKGFTFSMISNLHDSGGLCHPEISPEITGSPDFEKKTNRVRIGENKKEEKED